MPRSTNEPFRVLVAEDDRAIRRLLAATLRRAGIDVQLVENGAEAIDALKEWSWNAVVLDMMMPHVTGGQVVRWMAEHAERRPPCVVVVSAAGPDVLRELDPTIVSAIFFKPFDVVKLGAYVRNAVKPGRGDRRHLRIVKTL